jgi:hypothetical protein
MSGFFIIRQRGKSYEVVEHNNRSGPEGISIASFSTQKMAEEYMKNYTDKDQLNHDHYYQNLQTQKDKHL